MLDAGFDYRSEAFAFAEDIDRTSNPVEVVQRFLRVMRRLGLSGLTVGGLPTVSDERFEALVLVRSLPEEWRKRYFERRYFPIDPVIRRLKLATAPFEIRAGDYDSSGEPRVREVMEGRREFAQINAFVVPVQRPRGKGYVWMSGPRVVSPDAKPALHLMALYAFNRVDSLIASYPNRAHSLSEREREVLTWAAVGKTSWEIGEILGIAKRTVDAHTRCAARKLGAVNRTQAVAIALSDQAITV